MNQQRIMRYLHMGCGESLAASREKLASSLIQASARVQKPAETKKNRRGKGNEGGR